MSRISNYIKRICDIVISAVMLVVLSPFMLIIAIIIRAYDHSPAFFVQPRYTKDKKIFNIYKFRSMQPGTEEDYSLTIKEDPRITPIGAFIRRYRIDELPQLINVIKGDMSLVGPRPERPHLAEEIEVGLPEFADRLKVKAGLTGYAQVHGTYATPAKEKLKMDMYYIEHFSLWLDFKILIRTIGVIFDKRSSMGV